MQEVVFYLDFVSPYAWMVFQQLPQTLEGVDCHVRYRPVSSEALRKQAGLPATGPAAAQQAWALRHLQWLAAQHGCEGAVQTEEGVPAALPLLRLAHACAHDGETSRWVTECLFRQVWQPHSAEPAALRMQALQEQLLHCAEQQSPAAEEYARAQLRAMTQHAIDAGVFDVPALQWQGQLFFGWEGLAMLRSHIQQAPSTSGQ